MAHRLRWQAHIQASTDEDVRQVAQRMAHAMGRPLHVEDAEQYWKMPELRVLHGWTPLESGSFEGVVCEALDVAAHLAHRWEVGAPQTLDDGQWEFEGHAAAGHQCIRLSGVELLVWHIESDEPNPA